MNINKVRKRLLNENILLNRIMEKAFLLSYIHRTETCYKLVYAETQQEAESKLKEELDRMCLSLYGWENIKHFIKSETIL